MTRHSPRFPQKRKGMAISQPAFVMLVLFLGLLLPEQTRAQSPSEARLLPADFVNNRIHVTPVTESGDSLRLTTDTGGGRFPLLLQPAANRLDLPRDTITLRGRSMPAAPFPEFRSNASVPSPQNQEQFLVLPNQGMAKHLDADGQLGQSWFAGRVWTFDYGAERLLLHNSTESLSFDSEHTIQLAFRTDSTGAHLSHHARIEATIADTTHSFLFDTGATLLLSDNAQRVLDSPGKRGGNFVIASVFDRWRTEHPDWSVVKNVSGPRGNRPIIQVPSVTIAGHTVGPVWFERQPDRAFHKDGKLSIDQSVEGALGGSLFQYFRMTVDYPGERAYFERLD